MLHIDLENRLDIIELLFNSMPFVFWKNTKGIYVGANTNQIKVFGYSAPENFVGKTIFEILEDQESARLINDIDNNIMEHGVTSIVEEKIMTPTEGERTFLSQKQVIRDEEGFIIGLLGFAMDITEQKEKERLVELDNQKLIETAHQAAHDLGSPVASLLMMLKGNGCKNLPEAERIAFREVGERIRDIANNLLAQSKKQEQAALCMLNEQPQPILLSATILELLTEKRFQYQNLAIKFEHSFSRIGQFSFIKAQLASFQRMLSNLIDNAVDAFDDQSGTVMVKVNEEAGSIKIIVADNGKGMSKDLLDKIRKNISVTAGKTDGHGIGLTQVRDTLESNLGTMLIESILGVGTQIILEFPKVTAPAWIAERIILGKQDIVIILDDDHSIHTAWDTRFESILKEAPGIHLHHFESGVDTLNFIAALTDDEKNRLVLLTDFELLQQEFNGLEIIKQSKIKRSILVTSYYVNLYVREHATKRNIKILPKLLAAEIPIIVDESVNYSSDDLQQTSGLKKVNAVFLDDNQLFLEAMMSLYKNEGGIDYFYTAKELQANLANYAKDTFIYLDNQLGPPDLISGIELSKELHDLGFSNLILLSGRDFGPDEVPDYLTVILKTDIDKIKKW